MAKDSGVDRTRLTLVDAFPYEYWLSSIYRFAAYNVLQPLHVKQVIFGSQGRMSALAKVHDVRFARKFRASRPIRAAFFKAPDLARLARGTLAFIAGDASLVLAQTISLERRHMSDDYALPSSGIRVMSGPMKFCTECLKETYISVFHQMDWFVRCPIHQTVLRCNCNLCGAPTPGHVAWDTWSESPYRCASCGGFWPGVDPLRDWRTRDDSFFSLVGSALAGYASLVGELTRRPHMEALAEWTTKEGDFQLSEQTRRRAVFDWINSDQHSNIDERLIEPFFCSLRVSGFLTDDFQPYLERAALDPPYQELQGTEKLIRRSVLRSLRASMFQEIYELVSQQFALIFALKGQEVVDGAFGITEAAYYAIPPATRGKVLARWRICFEGLSIRQSKSRTCSPAKKMMSAGDASTFIPFWAVSSRRAFQEYLQASFLWLTEAALQEAVRFGVSDPDVTVRMAIDREMIESVGFNSTFTTPVQVRSIAKSEQISVTLISFGPEIVDRYADFSSSAMKPFVGKGTSS